MPEQRTPRKLSAREQLITPTDAEQRAVLRQWQSSTDGMDGQRGEMPEKSDDPIAYKLLDAAGDALERGMRQKGVNILRLVVRDYRETKEAAFARSVLDRLQGLSVGRGA